MRTDINRLRSLGYTVNATPGVAGGYRLGAGAVLPPQLLDDDEAVAVGLGTAAGGTVAGIEESSARALAKLKQVMPARLRHRVHTLHAAMVVLPSTATVVSLLTEIAVACRDRSSWNYRARITLRAPANAGAPKIPPAAWVLEAVDDQSCILDAGRYPHLLAVYPGALDVDFVVRDAQSLSSS